MEKEIQRVLDALKTLDPKDDAYAKLVVVLDELCRIADKYPRPEVTTITTEPVTQSVVVNSEPLQEEPTKVTKSAKTTKTVTNTEKAENDELSFESVRDLLTKAASAGVKIKDIISKYTPEGEKPKFSSVPTDKYKDIVEELSIYAI